MSLWEIVLAVEIVHLMNVPSWEKKVRNAYFCEVSVK